jgi:hypothetical protein
MQFPIGTGFSLWLAASLTVFAPSHAEVIFSDSFDDPAGSVATYGNTTLPGRMLVNNLAGPDDASVFDLRTGLRVVPPPSSPTADQDGCSTGANTTTVLRSDRVYLESVGEFGCRCDGDML